MIFSYFVFLTLSFLALGTAQECLQPENTSPIYVPADTLALITVNPSKGSCECSGGTEFYFASQNSSDTQYLFDNGFNDIINDCPTLCVCDINDNCYESPTVDPYPLIQLYSYCGSDGCHMRAVTFDILVNKNNGTQIGYDAQFENDMFKPLTNSVYLKVNRMSCSKCPIQTTCQPATIITSAPTTTIITSTTTSKPLTSPPFTRELPYSTTPPFYPPSTTLSPECIVPQNTSGFAFPTESRSMFYFPYDQGKLLKCQYLCSEATQLIYSPQSVDNMDDFISYDNIIVYTTCEDMCVCDILNNCYQFPNGTTTGGYWLYSICENNANQTECRMRGFNPTNNQLINIQTGAIIDPHSQYISERELKNFTDPSFIKVSKIDCGGCSRLLAFRSGYFPYCVNNTNPSTSTAPLITTTTTNPPAAQPCSNQPENTSAIYISWASYITDNIIIKDDFDGSNPRYFGSDFYFSPQSSADAEDLFFNEKDNIHTVCDNMCVCDIENNCYQYPKESTNGVWLFSICETDGCFMKAFNPTFTPLTNVVNGSQIDSNDQYVNPNELKPLTDPAYLKVSKIGCGGCSFLVTVPLCPISVVTPSIAPTPVSKCVKPANTSTIFIEVNSLSSLAYKQQPKGACSCSTGTEFYFETKNTSDTSALINQELDDLEILCKEMCICDINNNCYKDLLNPSFPGLNLYSYCDETDGCYMRAAIYQPIVNIATNETITMEDQYFDESHPKPLTDPIYLKINRMSCSSCSIENTCVTNPSECSQVTSTTPTPTTTIPFIPTIPTCTKPPNTSTLFVPIDSIDLIEVQGFPKSICECPVGAAFYFTSQTTNNTFELMADRVQSSDVAITCENLCFCDDDNTCYKYYDFQGWFTEIFSYCGDDRCYMRVVLDGNTIINTATNQTISDQDQKDGTVYNYKPLTNPIFPKATKITCNGCPLPPNTCESSVIP